MSGRRTAFELALAAILCQFLAACLFAHPTADDFIYASNARAGFWSAWAQEYLAWNGRYSSNALVLATPLAFGIAAYRLAGAMMIAGTAVAAYVFLRAWGGDALSKRDAMTCALAFSALDVSQMPSVGEGIYWYTSAATYQAWIAPALLHLALVVRCSRDRMSTRDWLGLAVAIALLVVVAGFNEIVMLMMVVFYTAWFVWSMYERTPGRIRAALLVAAIAIGGCVVLLSPGNAVRESMYPGVRHQFVRSLGWTALQTARFLADWLTSGALLMASVLFVPIADAWARRWQGDRRRAAQLLSMWIAAAALVVPIATFPAYWETGTLGQHRTVDAAYVTFLVLWFSAIVFWLVVGGRGADTMRSFALQWRPPAALAFLIALALTRNGYTVGSDLVSGRLARFDAAMQARYAGLQACRDRGDRVCEVDRIPELPATFAVLDVTPSPGDVANAAYARYFGVPAVRASGNGARPPQPSMDTGNGTRRLQPSVNPNVRH